jgi:hypothetical protein
MNTRRKTANPEPRALLEVTNVLTLATGPSIISTISNLKFTLQKKTTIAIQNTHHGTIAALGISESQTLHGITWSLLRL